jgi:hypothetical protein
MLDNILEIRRTRDSTNDVVNEKRRFFMKALRAAPAAMGRGTTRPGNTTAEPPKTPEKRGNAGSTILAVLIALVFIGIVTAAMVRNTGSQSTASIGYGTMQIMSSTVQSGMIATETYFKNNWQGVKAAMDTVLKDKEKSISKDKYPFIYGATNNKQPLSTSTNQYFTSQIGDLVNSNDDHHPQYVSFKINAGKNPGKKSLKNALAFYNIENKEDITITGDSEFGGMNAFSATDNAEYVAGNSGSVFKGHVTIEKGLTIQNKETKFLPDKDGNGSVYVKGKTKILHNAVFKVDAYFDDDVTFEGSVSDYANIFQKNTGFNGELDAGAGKTVKFGGDVWYNGDYKNQYNSQILSKLEGNWTNSKIYYTNKIQMKSSNFDNCGDNCIIHVRPHAIQKSEIMVEDASTTPKKLSFVNRDLEKTDPNSPVQYDQREITDIPAKMEAANGNNKGMTTIKDRKKEPDISMDIIIKEDGKEFLDITQVIGKEFTGPKLQNFYNSTRDDNGNIKPEYEKNYDNGHLLLKIPSGGATATGTPYNVENVFNGKVIFNVEGSFGVNQNFYSSTSNDASTLIYVGSSGTLDNFGVGDNGTFRGLVYVDILNTKNNTFLWGKDSKIEGAVIIKGGKLTWNTSGDIDLNRNDDVLRKFSFLKTDQTEQTNRTVEHKNEVEGVKLRAFGYYFY